MSTPLPQTIAQHFDGKGKEVRATYDRIMAIAREWGDVKPEAKKTSIHLLRASASFAGISTQKDALVLTFKADSDIRSPRLRKHAESKPGLWNIEIKLTKPQEVDHELQQWLKASYDLSQS
jgi:hypothetical protein